MSEIINFSKFFKDKKTLPSLDKEDLRNNFFVNESGGENVKKQTEASNYQQEKPIKEDTDDYSNLKDEVELSNESITYSREELDNLIKSEIERVKKESKQDLISENLDIETEDRLDNEEVENNTNVDNTDSYKLFNDKSEVFSCEIELEGANIKDTDVRLILETENWNLVFNGKVDRNGKVDIPIKKLNLFDEGTIGVIKMEVIAEGTLFVPYENSFVIKTSKKVMMKFNENNKSTQKNTGIKVNFKK